jgi:hypothetical protein
MVTQQYTYAYGAVSPQDGVFDSLDALEDHLVVALRNLEYAPDRVKSITAWDWIINAVSIAK